jgi:hypothetical protein
VLVRKDLTFCENLPLAGLASGGIWENHVQLIEQTFHFAPSLPLGHLVTYTKLRGSTVVSAASSHGSCVVRRALQVRDTGMLHGVVMCRCEV